MRKNIILVGANGSGKTTLATMMYHRGYHVFKLSPVSNEHLISVEIAESRHGVVFDRWSPIDQSIYRNNNTLLSIVIEKREKINDSNIIIYLNNSNNYDDSYDTQRVVQRPKFEDLAACIQKYEDCLTFLASRGLKIFRVMTDPDISKTLDMVERILKENE